MIHPMIFSSSARKKRPGSDEEMLNEFRSSRNTEVLGELYSGYMHLVYGVCLKYLKNREDSMDAVMHIFEKLTVEIPRHNIKNFKGWLHTVTKNYCLMQLRSGKTDRENFEKWLKDPGIFMENEEEMHPVDEMAPDMEEALLECIEKLKDEQKLCIEQFYFGNKCYNEIADCLNIDEKKVKSSLQNAKRNLKICLEMKNEGKKE